MSFNNLCRYAGITRTQGSRTRTKIRVRISPEGALKVKKQDKANIAADMPNQHVVFVNRPVRSHITILA